MNMASRLKIDHVVVRVDDLARAMTDYAALGFTVVPGGEHPGLGSRNALVAFTDDTYLELIEFRRPLGNVVVPKKKRFEELSAEGRAPGHCRLGSWEYAPEGLVDFAVVPVDIEETIRLAGAAGLKLHGPFPGRRLRPDGQEVTWQLGVPDGFDLPFLCADVTPRPLRVPGGDARIHANGTTGIQDITITVHSVEVAALRYRALLGCEPKSGSSARTACFMLGKTTIILEENLDADPREKERFMSMGEGPRKLSFFVAAASSRG